MATEPEGSRPGRKDLSGPLRTALILTKKRSSRSPRPKGPTHIVSPPRPAYAANASSTGSVSRSRPDRKTAISPAVAHGGALRSPACADQPTSHLAICAGRDGNELQPPEPRAQVRILLGVLTVSSANATLSWQNSPAAGDRRCQIEDYADRAAQTVEAWKSMQASQRCRLTSRTLSRLWRAGRGRRPPPGRNCKGRDRGCAAGLRSPPLAARPDRCCCWQPPRACSAGWSHSS